MKRFKTFFSVGLLVLLWAVFGLGMQINAYAAQFTDPISRVTFNYELSSDGTRASITAISLPNSFQVTHLKVPDKFYGVPVVAIAKGSGKNGRVFGPLKNSQVKSVELPDSVKEIVSYAFADLPKLETLSVNSDGIAIMQNAFTGSTKLKVVFRGTKPVKYISGYIFGDAGQCIDFNEIKDRAGQNSWIGYQKAWNNEAEWRKLVNSLTPFAISGGTESISDWEPRFDELKASDGYTDPQQIAENSISKPTYKAWMRKSAKWTDQTKEKVLIRLDVAYNMISSKQKNDMVFVLDVSGSMYYPENLIAGSDYSRQFQVFDNARSVAKALLDLNEEGRIYNRVGVANFGTNLVNSSRGSAQADKGFFSDYPNFIQWLDKVNYYEAHWTGYSYGLDEAVEMFRYRGDKSRNPNVLFLSDGEPNRPEHGGNEKFPGSDQWGYGGNATAELSNLGARRYSILLGPMNAGTYAHVVRIAGKPGESNDSSMAFSTPDSEMLKTVFEEIVMQMAESLTLNVEDTVGEKFKFNELPVVTKGSASLSGNTVNWSLSQTQACQEYTLEIVQDLKRNPEDYNAFYEGVLQTNLGDAVLNDAVLGTLLGVGSPVLEKVLPTHQVRINVTHGYAIGRDEKKYTTLEETVKQSSTYNVRYQPNADAVLQSITIAADGGTPVPIDVTAYPDEYLLEDIRFDYDVNIVYQYPAPPPGTWSLYAIAVNGQVTPEQQVGIAVGQWAEVHYEADSKEFKLTEILLDGTPVDDLYLYPDFYSATSDTADVIREIQITFSKEDEPEEPEKEEETWGDYRN